LGGCDFAGFGGLAGGAAACVACTDETELMDIRRFSSMRLSAAFAIT